MSLACAAPRTARSTASMSSRSSGRPGRTPDGASTPRAARSRRRHGLQVEAGARVGAQGPRVLGGEDDARRGARPAVVERGAQQRRPMPPDWCAGSTTSSDRPQRPSRTSASAAPSSCPSRSATQAPPGSRSSSWWKRTSAGCGGCGGDGGRPSRASRSANDAACESRTARRVLPASSGAAADRPRGYPGRRRRG